MWCSPGGDLSPEDHAPKPLFQGDGLSHLPLTLVSRRGPDSWRAQLSLPVPAARYGADKRPKVLPCKPWLLQPLELC